MVTKLALVEKSDATAKLELNHDNLQRGRMKWPERSGSIDDVSIVNLVQFLKPSERITFVNELHRVMKSGAKAQIIAPHWSASRAWGDLAFEQPPVAETWLFHLSADWRKANAPWGKGYKCDFDATWGYALHPSLTGRHDEYVQQAVSFWKEAAQDLVATLIKK